MAYSTTIYDPRKGIEAILFSISKFDKDRFLYALRYKHFNQQQLEQMAKHVAEYRKKLEEEHKRLLEFASIFNHRFVTDNNKCFETALKLLNKLRSGISEVKRIYLKFCPRWNRKRIPYSALSKQTYSAFDYSYFSTDSFQLSLFDLEGYPPYVQGLYNELSKFFFQLNLSLVLCMKVLEDEETIRKDQRYCNFLYEEFKQEVMKELMDIIMLLPTDSECFQEENNPAIASLKNYSNTEAWAPYGFHNFSKKDVKHLIIKEIQETEKRGILTKEEIYIFGNDPVKVNKIKNIILHFDELMPDNYNRTKLEAKLIAMFMQWCGARDEKSFVHYFNKEYIKNQSHHYDTVQKSAVNSAKNKLLLDNTPYNDFVKKLEKLHFISPSQSDIAI